MTFAPFVPRSNINQGFQIGAETVGTPGFGGTADQRLGTFNTQIAPVAASAFGVFRPSGGKYAGQVVPGDIYAEGPFTDTIDFNTMPFLFAGNVGYVAGSAVVDGATTWRHTPVPFGQGTTRSFVCEEGQTGAVYPYRGVVIPDLNLRFLRSGTSQVGGRLLGKKLDPILAFTDPTPQVRSGRSINSIKTGVWEAPNWADLIAMTGPVPTTATRLVPLALDLAWRHNNVFAPWFGLQDDIISYGGTLEDAIDAGVQISIGADVDVDDIRGVFNYSNMEDGETIFLKVLTVGPLIGATSRFSLMIDMCLTISGPPRRATSGPMRIWQWDALMKPDNVTPFLPFDITVICETPATAIPAIVV